MSKFNIKKIFILSSTLIIALVISIFSISVYNDDISLNFGSTNDPIPKKRLKNDCCRKINPQGLAELKAYGSGTIYFPDFRKYLSEKTKSGEIKKLFVVNLLSDEIYYYKDRCLRWYGLHYKKNRLGEFLFTHKPYKTIHTKFIRLIYGTPPVHDISQLQTERQIIQELGGHYYDPFKNKKNWLGNSNFIEGMIQFFESIPKDAHLYIHCVHGRGRTTTFLVFYDIFKNAKTVPLKDITDRHYCLGREDVLNTELWAKGTWTQSALNARKELVTRFYNFMADPKGYGYQSWPEWNQLNPSEITPIIVHRRDKHHTEFEPSK